MQKFMLTLLVAIIALAPAIAAAQTGSSGSGTPGSSGSSTPSGTSGGTGSGTSSGSGTTTTPGASGGTSTPPSASPSGTSSDFSQYTTNADCEKAGGMWQTATSKCEKK